MDGSASSSAACDMFYAAVMQRQFSGHLVTELTSILQMVTARLRSEEINSRTKNHFMIFIKSC